MIKKPVKAAAAKKKVAAKKNVAPKKMSEKGISKKYRDKGKYISLDARRKMDG